MPKVSRVGKFRKTAAVSRQQQPSSKSEDEPGPVNASVVSAPSAKDVGSVEPRPKVSDGVGEAQDSHQQLSRGQRKRMAKREQYLKRERMVLSCLKLKREEEQKKRIDGLGAMREALLATVTTSRDDQRNEGDNEWQAESRPLSMLRSNKSRQVLLQKETAQLNLVLQHPAFLADPFSTIREHFTNTLAKDVEKNKKQAAQHIRERQEKQMQKKAFKKEQQIKKKKTTKRCKPTKARSRK